MNNTHSLKRYLVILADRQKSKFFTIYGDTFEDDSEEIVEKDVPQKVKVEHTRPGKVQSHIREHLHKHLKHVGQRALAYTQRQHKQVDGVIVGGHDELLSTIRKYLPSQLKNKVIGEFTADTDLSIGDLTGKAKRTISEITR